MDRITTKDNSAKKRKKDVTVMPRQSKPRQRKCKMETAPEPEIAGAQLITSKEYLTVNNRNSQNCKLVHTAKYPKPLSLGLKPSNTRGNPPK